MKKLNFHVWLFDQCEIHQCEIATIDPVDHSIGPCKYINTLHFRTTMQTSTLFQQNDSTATPLQHIMQVSTLFESNNLMSLGVVFNDVFPASNFKEGDSYSNGCCIMCLRSFMCPYVWYYQTNYQHRSTIVWANTTCCGICCPGT